jgi:hypothetical protein
MGVYPFTVEGINIRRWPGDEIFCIDCGSNGNNVLTTEEVKALTTTGR